MKTYCETHNCPWFLGTKCNSPNDPQGNECDYNWATECGECGKLIAVGYDDGGYCPYCGADLSENE